MSPIKIFSIVLLCFIMPLLLLLHLTFRNISAIKAVNTVIEHKQDMATPPLMASTEESAPNKKYSLRFEKAFLNLIHEEGGYVDNPHDKGGETKYGISKRSYPDVDIKNLTLNQAKAIYKKDFWDVIKGDDLRSDEVACEVLEQAVNMGSRTAVSFLQITAVAYGKEIVVDGKMGAGTLKALGGLLQCELLIAIKALAISHYINLAREEPPMKVFLKGWIKRVTS